MARKISTLTTRDVMFSADDVVRTIRLDAPKKWWQIWKRGYTKYKIVAADGVDLTIEQTVRLRARLPTSPDS